VVDSFESLEPGLRRPPLKNKILAFDVTQDAERTHESSDKGMAWLRPRQFGDRARGQYQGYARDPAGLLRARRERQCSRRAEQRDELAAFQLIELHSIPARGSDCRIPNLRWPVSGYASHSATGQPVALHIRGP
jgi:hypothetical protein